MPLQPGVSQPPERQKRKNADQLRFWQYHKMSMSIKTKTWCNNDGLFLGLDLMSFCLWKWSQTSPTMRWAGLVFFLLIHFSGSKHKVWFWIACICSKQLIFIFNISDASWYIFNTFSIQCLTLITTDKVIAVLADNAWKQMSAAEIQSL